MSREQGEESDLNNKQCDKNNEAIESGKSSKSESGGKDKSCVVYEGDKCVYIDPSTKCRYVWDNDKNDWVPDGDYQFDGTTYSCVDKKTGIKYHWDTDKSEWVVIENQQITTDTAGKKDSENGEDKLFPVSDVNTGGDCYGFENDTHTYTDPADNTVYMWDRAKSAWFPKVDDNFLAHYQMNYGFIDPNKDSLENEKICENKPSKIDDDVKEGEKRKAQQQEPTWFEVDELSNTKVYVSNLPLDINEKEFVDLMQKCGLVMKDIDTGKMKVKLYTEPGSNQLKGDGLCTYIKKESVDLALNLLDGYDYKGRKLHVERAKFTMKGSAYDPSLKPKKRKKKDKEKLKKIQEKLFDWRPDKLRGERSRNESVVIVKNLFEPSTFDKDVKLILEYQQDLREECQKLGAIKRVIIYDRHPEGVAQINFKEAEAADACVQLLNGRWFNKRQITAETWDGKTKYKIIETEEELKKRLAKWDSFLLLDGERKKEDAAANKANENKEIDEKIATDSEERDSDQETKSSGGSDEELD